MAFFKFRVKQLLEHKINGENDEKRMEYDVRKYIYSELLFFYKKMPKQA